MAQKSSNKIIMRTDSNTTIGMGHLSRCLTLASALIKMGVSVTFCITDPSPAVVSLVASAGCSIVKMPAGLNQEQDLGFLLNQSKQIEATGMVVDGYHFKQEYLDSAAADICTLYFDELMELDLKVALVLNQNLYADESDYRSADGSRLLLGPQYAVLRDEFISERHKRNRPVPARAKKIFINFGGSDPSNLTTIGLKGLNWSKYQYQIKVVLGALNPYAEEVQSVVADSHHQVEVLNNIGNMAQVMGWADIALSASGTTTLEMACLGLPSVLVIQVDNQRRIGLEMGSRGLAIQLGWWQDVTPDMMVQAVDNLATDSGERKRQSEKCLKTVDGKGAYRVAKAIIAASQEWSA